jgi:hypothetical protein
MEMVIWKMAVVARSVALLPSKWVMRARKRMRIAMASGA